MRLILAALVILSISRVTHAQEIREFVVDETLGPPAALELFCKEYVHECVANTNRRDEIVRLTPVRQAELEAVNVWVNHQIRYMGDFIHWGMLDHWDFAEDGYGDCEEYVLRKKRMLVSYGWPRSALLMTLVRTEMNEGHMVLMVRTDRGSLIMDNRRNGVQSPTAVGYRFVGRESVESIRKWYTLKPAPVPELRFSRFK